MATAIFGEHAANTLEQFHEVAGRAEHAALLPDGHLGYVMPIGGVAAYDGRVSIVGVGFDIACGNAAIRTDLGVDDLDDPESAADALFRLLPFGVGARNDAPDAPRDDPLFEDPRWEAIPRAQRATLRAKARDQLGTTGGGNHYVDVLADEQGALWIGVHFGSRGFGHAVANGFLALASGARWGEKPQPGEHLVALADPLGEAYWNAMNLAGAYAYAGREWVARKAAEVLGGRELELVHNHHNFAWLERHHERELVVVRKGATPAWPGQRGFVGGSMGDEAVILEGAHAEGEDAARQQQALYSTVHGAGRVMSRTAAKGKWRKGRVVRAGAVSHRDMHAWLEARGVVLRGGDLDEAPQAYRRLDDVLAVVEGTVTVRHRLRPLIVCMAPGNSRDPYR